MKQILIIEDDPNISSALSIRLKAAGYNVLAAPDGLRGLKLARNHWPDLILLDVGLPLLDIRMPLGVGYSVARRLKAIGRGDIPVIIITASKEKGIREAAKEVGAVAFFEKPYDPEELLHTIDQILHAQVWDGVRTARRSLDHEAGAARCDSDEVASARSDPDEKVASARCADDIPDQSTALPLPKGESRAEAERDYRRSYDSQREMPR